MATPDLFDRARESASAKLPESGLLATNHLNLMYMLAAGLVMPPDGFGDKYYRDTLCDFPGWIPLFIDKVPRRAIQLSIEEANYLKPVIVKFKLSGLSGPMSAIQDSGSSDVHFPMQIDGAEPVLLVPAPLPVSRIESIIFSSQDDKKKCRAEASEFGNVPIGCFQQSIRKSLFTKASTLAWPILQGPEARNAPIQAPLAVGGVIAMLLRFANLGGRVEGACRIAFDPESGVHNLSSNDPITSGLEAWVRDGEASEKTYADLKSDQADAKIESHARLLWAVVTRVVEWRESRSRGSLESVLVGELDAATRWLDPKTSAGVSKLRDSLISLTGLGDATSSELFDRHQSPLARALILLLLRRDCADLFEYRNDRLGEADWLIAAILFGARDGWMNLPLTLRGDRGHLDAVSHRVARLSHRIAKSGLDLGEAPPRVRPLRELFGDGANWRALEKSAALELSRRQKWNCVRTRITLGPGQYRLIVKSGSTQILIPGEPKISPDISLDRFFALLGESRLENDVETEIRRLLRA